VVGFLSVDWLLNWFHLPANLELEARQLWLLMLCVNASIFPLRVNAGILFSQNRSYWTSVGWIVSLWAGFVAFWMFLRVGAGSLAYGYSSLIAIGLSSVVGFVAVRRGPNSLRFSWSSIVWADMRHLFGFSSYIFLIGISIQVVFMSQEMILTKTLGLAVVAGYNISIKSANLGMSFIFRTFDASIPRWQQMFVAGESHRLRASFQRKFSLALGLLFTGAIAVVAGNRFLVSHWANASFYQGRWFDVILAAWVVQVGVSHCFCCLLPMAKRVRMWAICAVIEAVLNICLGVLLAPKLGATGVLVASILSGVVSFAYIEWEGRRILGLGAREFYGRVCAGAYVLAAVYCVLGVGMGAWAPKQPTSLVQVEEMGLIALTGVIFSVFFGAEVLNFGRPLLERLKVKRAALL
jgi:O-antigen/teichoic acid export membrane protein